MARLHDQHVWTFVCRITKTDGVFDEYRCTHCGNIRDVPVTPRETTTSGAGILGGTYTMGCGEAEPIDLKSVLETKRLINVLNAELFRLLGEDAGNLYSKEQKNKGEGGEDV